jgi:hypothetical protein
MKFKLTKTSTYCEVPAVEIEFNSLEELSEWQIKEDNSIIVDFRNNTIEIYDNYRE